MVLVCVFGGFGIGYLTGLGVGRFDKGAAAKAAIRKQALSEQMDDFASITTVRLATDNPYAAAAAQPFIEHGARYSGKNADFVFDVQTRGKLGYAVLIIRNAKGDVLHSANIAETIMARFEGQKFLATLAQGGRASGNQRYIQIQSRASKVLGDIAQPH